MTTPQIGGGEPAPVHAPTVEQAPPAVDVGGHRFVPVSQPLRSTATRTWWRCIDCDDRWLWPPEEDDPCEAAA